MLNKTTALLALLATTSASAQTDLLINEYSIDDEYSSTTVPGLTIGDVNCRILARADVVEIYNNGTGNQTLTGCYLSDDPADPTKWEVPTLSSGGDIILAPGDHYVIYCTGSDTVVLTDEVYSNFTLEQGDNESIVLTSPALATLDQVDLNPRLTPGLYRGRITDGNSQWGISVGHTIGSSNGGTFFNGLAEQPNFSVAAGTYAGTQSLTLSTGTSSDSIFYTLDGTEPTNASLLYSAPISVSSTMPIRAITYSTDPNLLPSIIETNTYLIGTSHQIPIVSVSGTDILLLMNGAVNDEPDVHMEYFDCNGSNETESSGTAIKSGNDSWAFPNRSIYFVSEDYKGVNDALEATMFNSTCRDEFRNIEIRAQGIDNFPHEPDGALMREALAQALIDKAGSCASSAAMQPCALYINGQYWGLYWLREFVTGAPDNTGIPDHKFDAGFFDYNYDLNEYQVHYKYTWGATWDHVGCADTDWDDLVAYATTNDLSVPANYAFVEGQLDISMFIDYMVINTYLHNKNWMTFNTGWWHAYPGNGQDTKWRYHFTMMDLTWNHGPNYFGWPTYSAYMPPCEIEGMNDPGGQGHQPMLNALLANPGFESLYLNRWGDLHDGPFSCENLQITLDSIVCAIDSERAGHVARWGGTVADWDLRLQDLRDFICERCDYMDYGLDTCYSFQVQDDTCNMINYTCGPVCNNCSEPAAHCDQYVSVPEIGQEPLDILVYPNPSEGRFTFEIPDLHGGPIRYQVFNSVGSLLMDQRSNGANFSLDLGQYERGVYYVVLQMDGHRAHAKLIRQ